jgi:hypothetical protein
MVNSPHPDLHLVVGIICTGVEDVQIPCFEVCTNVSFPEITMNQTWFHGPPIGFESSQQPWYDMSQRLVHHVIKLFPSPVRIDIQLVYTCQQSTEEQGPAALPIRDLWQSPIICRYIKTKLPRGRNAFLVELGETFSKLDRIGKAIGNVDKFAKEEVGGWRLKLKFSSGKGTGNQSRHRFEQLRHRLEFTLQLGFA